jgi:hypothetical protein
LFPAVFTSRNGFPLISTGRLRVGAVGFRPSGGMRPMGYGKSRTRRECGSIAPYLPNTGRGTVLTPPYPNGPWLSPVWVSGVCVPARPVPPARGNVGRVRGAISALSPFSGVTLSPGCQSRPLTRNTVQPSIGICLPRPRAGVGISVRASGFLISVVGKWL